MRLLDWVKRRGKEPEDEPTPSPHETRDGSPIRQLWRSEWNPDDHGLQEFRHHVGKSDSGFHGGLEVSNRGGEGPFKWGCSMRTFDEAQKASYGMREGWEFSSSWRDGTYEEPDDQEQARKHGRESPRYER